MTKNIAGIIATFVRGAWWCSGRASDSESRGPWFDPYKRHHVVSLSKTHSLPTVLVTRGGGGGGHSLVSSVPMRDQKNDEKGYFFSRRAVRSAGII